MSKNEINFDERERERKKSDWDSNEYWTLHNECKDEVIFYSYILWPSDQIPPKLLSSLSELNNTSRMFKGIAIKYGERMNDIAHFVNSHGFQCQQYLNAHDFCHSASLALRLARISTADTGSVSTRCYASRSINCQVVVINLKYCSLKLLLRYFERLLNFYDLLTNVPIKLAKKGCPIFDIHSCTKKVYQREFQSEYQIQYSRSMCQQVYLFGKSRKKYIKMDVLGPSHM